MGFLCWFLISLTPAAAHFDWLLGGRAQAQSVPETRSVLVTFAGEAPLDDALRAALRELFARVGLQLVEAEQAQERALVARVRIARDEEGATVRVLAASSRRVESVHRVQNAETEALFRETLAHVVLGAVEPLAVAAEGLPVEPPPVPAKPAQAAPPEKEAAPKRARPSAHFGAALAAGPQLLTDSWGVRLSGRADAYVATRLPGVFGLTLGGVLPQQHERADTQSKLWLSFFRLQAGIEPWIRSLFRLGILLTAGADLISVSVTSERPAERVSSPLWRVDAMLGALTQARFLLPRGLELQLVLGCDVDLTPRSFVVQDGGQTRTLFALSRARPYAGFAIAWSSL